MTSGMSAKGSALGTGVPGSGVPADRAQASRKPGDPGSGGPSGNGSKPGRASKTGANSGEAGIAATPQASGAAHPALAASVRTLILGIDHDGRIVQHDRNAPRILAREPSELLGAQLSDLTA